MMSKRVFYFLCLIPLLVSCQKYTSPPYDEYEKILRTTKTDGKGIVIDSLWNKRDSLSYLRFKNLKFIYLKSVKTIPKWITNFDSLSILSNTVDKSYIVSIDSSLSFPNLKTLNLGNSEIEKIPASIYRLESLSSLNLNENRIVDVSNKISQLKNLKSINLSKNPIFIIPNEICDLKKLESLILENTKIKDLPKCLENLQNLEWINVSGTQITYFPIEILNAKKLETIHAKRLNIRNYQEVKAICKDKNITLYYDE